MAEYIEREKAYEKCGWYNTVNGKSICAARKDELAAIPSADVSPVRHGRWIDAYPDIEPNPMFMYGICSACGFEQGISKYLKYCPDCGAKMDLEG